MVNTAASTVVEMSDVGKRYGSHWVLSRVNLKVKRGESIGLFGGNGSGKSTLLKIMATLLPPSTGRMTVLGDEAEGRKRKIRGRLRFLAHEKQLYSALTVLENLQLTASLRGVSSGKADSQIQEILERFRIDRFGGCRISQLSEGMKKRVVIGRLLIGPEEPELILLDEPHPTLDLEGRKILDGLITDWRRSGKAILLASHDHAQALAHVDRLLVLEGGRISYDGPPGKFL